MRFKLWCVLFTAAIVPATLFGQPPAPSNFGDVVPGKALRVTISGELTLSLVNRNRAMFRAALGPARSGVAPTPLVGPPAVPGTAAPAAGSGGETILDPRIALNIDVQLAEGVNTFLQLATPFRFGDEGGTNTAGVGTTTSNGVVRRDLEVEQIYVQWAGAFVPELTLKFGIQEFKHDFTGNQNPFFVDVTRSESPFGNPNAVTDVGTPQSSSGGLVNTQEAAGAHALYELGDIDTEVFYFTINESFRKNNDQTLFGVTLSTDSGLAEELSWNAGGGLYVLQSDSSSLLYTVGGGGAVNLLDDALKLYGEVYAQWGGYRDVGLGKDIKQKESYAFYVGSRYSMSDVTWSPYVDLSYWEISGDDNGGDSSNENFVSLENNNDSLIIEDGYYGLDIDTNYRALKVKAGFSPHEDLRFDAMYAYFELQENNGSYSNVASTQDKLGDEIDLNLRYFATDYLTFRLATGWLFDAQALESGGDLHMTLLEARVEF